MAPAEVRLTAEQAASLHRDFLAATGTERAALQKKLLTALNGMAVSAARAVPLPHGYEFSDAVSVAALGIAETLEDFDVTRGMALMGWASWQAKTALLRWLDDVQPLKVPGSTRRDWRKAGTLEDRAPKPVSLDDIAEFETHAPSALEALCAKEDRQELYAALKVLGGLEERVVRLAYGLNTAEVSLDAAEISEELGLPVRQVRQVLKAALAKLATALQVI